MWSCTRICILEIHIMPKIPESAHLLRSRVLFHLYQFLTSPTRMHTRVCGFKESYALTNTLMYKHVYVCAYLLPLPPPAKHKLASVILLHACLNQGCFMVL